MDRMTVEGLSAYGRLCGWGATTPPHGKPGKTADLKKALPLIAPTRQEAGCINYDLHQAPDTTRRNSFFTKTGPARRS